jgi:hypothetical protein
VGEYKESWEGKGNGEKRCTERGNGMRIGTGNVRISEGNRKGNGRERRRYFYIFGEEE